MYTTETGDYSVRWMAPKSTLINVIRLTIVSDVDGNARIENSEHAGVIEARSVRRDVLDLQAETESMSTGVRPVTIRVVYLGAMERRARASGIGNVETVLGEGVQDSTRIVEELESPVTGVGDGYCDLQVLQSTDVDIGCRGLESQAGGSKNRGCSRYEGDEGSTYGRREHCGEGSEGCWNLMILAQVVSQSPLSPKFIYLAMGELVWINCLAGEQSLRDQVWQIS